VTAVRILQAQGLPQARIHALLFGRSDKELRKILEHTAAPVLPRSKPQTFDQAESWLTTPVDDEFLLISRRGNPIPPAALARIRSILAEVSASRTLNTL
jgi:hypothetical protein